MKRSHLMLTKRGTAVLLRWRMWEEALGALLLTLLRSVCPLGAGHSFQYCPYAIVHLIQKRKHDDPYYISVNRVLATCVTYLLI